MNIDDLKREVILENGFYSDVNQGWNEAIDYLASRGYLPSVQRIDLLENSLTWLDKFISDNGLDENGGLLRIRKAARAYLAQEAEQLRKERDEFKELYDVMVERYTELAKKVAGE